MIKFAAVAVIASAVLLLFIKWLGELPSIEGRSVSHALTNTSDTSLGKAISPLAAEHANASGVYPLSKGTDAFAARALLAAKAERSVDVQYYIWHQDATGTLLFNSLKEAADRGVRVRLLLDDNNTAGLDGILAELAAHRNIEVRLFNPLAIRSPRILSYLADFPRLNRRMHNKSFTVDNQATIIGGRNIGDEYFGAAEGTLFVDLDMLAVGPIVSQVSEDFDRYWSSSSSYPAELLLPVFDRQTSSDIASAAQQIERNLASATYVNASRNSSFVQALVHQRLPFEWAETRLVSDDPRKGLGLAPPEALLPQKLKTIIGEPERSLDLISAYFVPAEVGTQTFEQYAGRGVRVTVLTNSVAATDVWLVHAGYIKRRKALLKAGVVLYELRWLSPERPRDSSAGPGGSSSASLHAKTFASDGARLFIGSFNFDPRSARLNTELGFIIDSTTLAQRVEDLFENDIPANSYQVHLADSGSLFWTEQRNNATVRHETEPETGFILRVGVWLLSFLPIESLL